MDEGTSIGVESPAYLAALQVFRLFGARFQPITPCVDFTPGEAPVMAYVTPTFQNPTGRCWTLEERKGLAASCDAHDVVLFEDDPYRDLVFGPCERTPVASFVTSAEWIYQSSFSKTVAPGLRLGFLAASEGVFQNLAFLKQAADLHSNRLSQWIVLNYLNDPNRAQRMSALVGRYTRRRDLFAAAMAEHLGGLADWEVPQGGLFFWLTLRDGLDAAPLLDACVARGVLFTPGSFFEAFGAGTSSTLRLNFSHADEASAERGLKIIGEEVRRLRG
jgi:DNA-binding transcriptional MocR family regulator